MDRLTRTANIIKAYYSYDSKTPYDKGQFDEYEQHIDQEISRLFT